MTHLLDYQPLNLYTNYQEAAEKTPTVPIIFDESLPAFPALGLETTYGESHQEILKRAYQLAALGVKKGDKITSCCSLISSSRSCNGFIPFTF